MTDDARSIHPLLRYAGCPILSESSIARRTKGGITTGPQTQLLFARLGAVPQVCLAFQRQTWGFRLQQRDSQPTSTQPCARPASADKAACAADPAKDIPQIPKPVEPERANRPPSC